MTSHTRATADTQEPSGREQVRDKWKYSDQLMDHPEVTPIDHVVALAILRYTRSDYGDAVIDQEHIARLTKVSKRSVATSTKRLARLGFIEIIPGHGLKATNAYRPRFPRPGTDDASASNVVQLKVHEVHPQSAPDARKYSGYPSGYKKDTESGLGSVPQSPTVSERGADAPPRAPAVDQAPRKRPDLKLVPSGRTPVPDNLKLADLDYALAKGMAKATAGKLATRFINHYRANGVRLCDWSAKWRNWVDKEPIATGRDPSMM